MKMVLATVGFLGAISYEQASAQQVSIQNNEPSILAKKTVIYEAVCPDAKYSLSIDYSKKIMTAVIRNADDTKTYNLSNSIFADTFLKKPLYGVFGISCASQQLRVFYQGFEVQPGKSPRPVSYHMDLNSDGHLQHDGGLEDEKVEFFNQYPKSLN
jgi:hypothetical protein